MYRRCARSRSSTGLLSKLSALVLAFIWLPACAQNAPAPAEVVAAPAFTAQEIADLVAPVALYPDDLLAIVLPASTYPLQIVQAQRFLDASATDPTLKPGETWDDSVVALLNYPEVVKLMSDDLDWTSALGEAVLGQQSDVLSAIEGFRKRAYTAGNLRTDDRQVVALENDTVYIRPADPQVIYVPYYEPARMTVYHSAPAYHYYPRPYPVYYYPYPLDYAFSSGFFWGVTTFYSLGWNTHHVHVYDYDYYGHPYYSRRHQYHHDRYYYRHRQTVVNNYYGDRDYGDRDGHRGRDYDDRDGDHDRDGDRDYNGRDGRSDGQRGDGRYERDRGDQYPGRDDIAGSPRDGDRDSDDPRAGDGNRESRGDTFWRPDYRRTGARPGADPRRRSRDRTETAARDAVQNPATSVPGAEPQASERPVADRDPGRAVPDANGRMSSDNDATPQNAGTVPAGATPPSPVANDNSPSTRPGARSRDGGYRRYGQYPGYANQPGPRDQRPAGSREVPRSNGAAPDGVPAPTTEAPADLVGTPSPGVTHDAGQPAPQDPRAAPSRGLDDGRRGQVSLQQRMGGAPGRDAAPSMDAARGRESTVPSRGSPERGVPQPPAGYSPPQAASRSSIGTESTPPPSMERSTRSIERQPGFPQPRSSGGDYGRQARATQSPEIGSAGGGAESRRSRGPDGGSERPQVERQQSRERGTHEAPGDARPGADSGSSSREL